MEKQNFVTIGINSFVRRQTKESSYSYYKGDMEDLEILAQAHFFNGKVTQKDEEGNARVVVVPVPADNFFSSTIQVKQDTNIVSVLYKRREEEEAYIKNSVEKPEKFPAKYVELILYSKDALQENSENSTYCDYEIVSINASLGDEEPMHPITMARNFLEKTGGTKAVYTAEEFANAIWYWKDKISG